MGLAPFNRDSGSMRGTRSIRGGRGDVRQSLFLAIFGSWRCSDSPITTFVRRLREKGKPSIVAGMRKTLVIADTLIRKNCSWNSEMSLA
ncbi:MAG: transposase [Myxococcales bacterium]|nr:transposase [Myxococcales bacterium]